MGYNHLVTNILTLLFHHSHLYSDLMSNEIPKLRIAKHAATFIRDYSFDSELYYHYLLQRGVSEEDIGKLDLVIDHKLMQLSSPSRLYSSRH